MYRFMRSIRIIGITDTYGGIASRGVSPHVALRRRTEEPQGPRVPLYRLCACGSAVCMRPYASSEPSPSLQIITLLQSIMHWILLQHIADCTGWLRYPAEHCSSSASTYDSLKYPSIVCCRSLPIYATGRCSISGSSANFHNLSRP